MLDLGAGVGTAALVAMALDRAEKADLVERDAPTLALAQTNLDENGLAGRGRVLSMDITAKAPARRAAGLHDNGYDVVIANPPFFDAGQGTLAPDTRRADARHMDGAALDMWLRCAAASAKAGGTAIVIYPARGLGALLGSFELRFGGIIILPLAPRPGDAATRLLLRGSKGSRAPLQLLATRFLHGPEGNGLAPEFDAIFRGTAMLDW